MHTIRRRRLLTAATLAGAAFTMPLAWAQGFPSKTVKIVVPFAPGGPTDTSARIVATALGKETGGTFVVENIPGAGARIGTTQVADAAPDGYTLLWGSASALTVAPALYHDLKYDSNTSFAPISVVAAAPFVLVTRASLGVNDLATLIARAKANPGKLNYGSTGVGASAHMITELFLSTAGIKATHIPYSGGAPMAAALRRGEIDFLFDTPTTVAALVQDKAGTPLAVTSLVRWPELPDVKTLDESGLKGFDVTAWFGLLAPKGTPQDVIDILNKKIAAVLKQDGVRKALRAAGFSEVGSTPAEFADRLRAESRKWTEVAKAANIKVH